MSKFPWGKVIGVEEYDFDGDVMVVTKYYPHIYENGRVTGKYQVLACYHIEELHSSFNNLHYAIIAYIAYKNIGLNVDALVCGVARALCVKGDF